MSTEYSTPVASDFEALHKVARELGALPELKLTDRGLVQYDAAQQRLKFVNANL